MILLVCGIVVGWIIFIVSVSVIPYLLPDKSRPYSLLADRDHVSVVDESWSSARNVNFFPVLSS